MKIIFLDFDGVINNWNKFDGIDEANVINLKEIIHATSAKIVVTSSKNIRFKKILMLLIIRKHNVTMNTLNH